MFAADVIAQNQTIELFPTRDNTLYESNTGDVSNGQGEFLFIGRTDQSLIRRSLLHFDVAGELPENARIVSARLQVRVSNAVGGPQPATVHEVLGDWGEGNSRATGPEGTGANSAAGDATWLHAFYPDEAWQTPGGDFAGVSLTETTINSAGLYTFESTPALVLLLQEWQTTPETNFGLMIRGNEGENRVAKRLGSRHNSDESSRPRLVIEYEPVSTSVREEQEVATEFRILNNYPNPFNPETVIRYSVDAPGETRISVYNMTGQEVWREVRSHARPGVYETRFNALGLTSGLYLARITNGNRYSNVIKMTLLK